MSVWDDAEFAGVADNIRVAMTEDRERDLTERRKLGLAAYVAAHERRDGARRERRGQIVNSFAAMLGLESDDDL